MRIYPTAIFVQAFILISALTSGQVASQHYIIHEFIEDTSRNTLPDSVLHSIWSSTKNGWEKESKHIITYNNNLYREIETSSVWKDEQWELNRRTEFSYSETYLNQKTLYAWDDYEINWIEQDQYTYIYDSNQHLSHVYDAKWSFGDAVWINDSLFVFEYNEQQLLSRTNAQIWSTYATEWQNLTETSFDYSSGINTRQVFSLWDFGYLVFEPHQIKTLSYNEKQELIGITQQKINSFHTEWLNDNKKTFVYYNHGKLQEETYYSWSNTDQDWVEIYQILYQYDANLNLTNKTQFYYDWDLLIWSNQSRTIYDYNRSNQLISTTYYYWNYSKWNPLDLIQYFYPNYTAINEDVSPIAVHPYPNPAKDILYVEFSPEWTKIPSFSVLDIYGRTIFQGNFTDYPASVDVSNLKNGIYIMQLNFENKTASTKFCIQK